MNRNRSFESQHLGYADFTSLQAGGGQYQFAKNSKISDGCSPTSIGNLI